MTSTTRPSRAEDRATPGLHTSGRNNTASSAPAPPAVADWRTEIREFASRTHDELAQILAGIPRTQITSTDREAALVEPARPVPGPSVAAVTPHTAPPTTPAAAPPATDQDRLAALKQRLAKQLLHEPEEESTIMPADLNTEGVC